MEPELKQDKIRVNIKISAKGIAHGEYTFRGDTQEEAKRNGEIAYHLFSMQVKTFNDGKED